MLVAPVRIGAAATVGAGSTITSAAPPGKLTLTRSPQVTSPSWTRPRKRSADEHAAAVERAFHEPRAGDDPPADPAPAKRADPAAGTGAKAGSSATGSPAPGPAKKS
jgi:hypothetical protein